MELSLVQVRLGQLLEQGRQLQKRLRIEPPRWPIQPTGWRRVCPVCPFPRNTEAATLRLAEKQCVDTGDAPFLEYFEALAAQWVERMADLRPS